MSDDGDTIGKTALKLATIPWAAFIVVSVLPIG